MPNWGAEIDVTIIDRKPDFVGDDDRVLVFHRSTVYADNTAEFIIWHPAITKIKLLPDHPYYKKEKTMVISREAAIEALKRFGQSYDDISVDRVVRGKMDIGSHELAKAIQELWDACPDKRPVDNRVIAMRHAYPIAANAGPGWLERSLSGEFDEHYARAVPVYHAKIAELEAGK